MTIDIETMRRKIDPVSVDLARHLIDRIVVQINDALGLLDTASQQGQMLFMVHGSILDAMSDAFGEMVPSFGEFNRQERQFGLTLLLMETILQHVSAIRTMPKDRKDRLHKAIHEISAVVAKQVLA